MTSILLFGLLAAAANVLGGLVLIKSGAHRWGERFLKYLVALGAGFMLAAIFIEILPTTIDIWTKSSPGNSDAVVGAMTLLSRVLALVRDDRLRLDPDAATVAAGTRVTRWRGGARAPQDLEGRAHHDPPSWGAR